MEHWAKRMGLTRMGMLIASKPHCHPRLPQPILKILSIYSNNFSGNNFQAICFSYCFIHQNFNDFVKKSIKVVRYLPRLEVAVQGLL